MTPEAILTYVFMAAALISALFVILKSNPVSSAFSLVLVFFCFAGIFAALGAHFLAAIQVLVYAGAIMVLFVFVIMLLNVDVKSLDLKRTHALGGTSVALLVAVFAGVFTWIFRSVTLPGPIGAYSVEAIEKAGGNTRVISELMFSEWVLPFELTSILLLAAIVGTVAIAKRKKGKVK